jgi:cytochrome c
MKCLRYTALGFLAVFLCAGFMSPASAGEVTRGTKEEAKALVEKAVAYFEANGKEKTLAAIQDDKGQFIDRDLYVYAVSMGGVRLANPKYQKLVGSSMVGFKDGDGKAYGDEMIALAASKGEGWVDYKFADPITKNILPKAAYLKKAGDMFFVCGAYAQ